MPRLPWLIVLGYRYLNEHALGALPDDDDDVFDEDPSVRFSDLARPHEHKKAIAVNAFVSPRNASSQPCWLIT
jgi:hypothetical protein